MLGAASLNGWSIAGEMRSCYRAGVHGEIPSQDVVRLTAALRSLAEVQAKLPNSGPEAARAPAQEDFDGMWDDDDLMLAKATYALASATPRERDWARRKLKQNAAEDDSRAIEERVLAALDAEERAKRDALNCSAHAKKTRRI